MTTCTWRTPAAALTILILASGLPAWESGSAGEGQLLRIALDHRAFDPREPGIGDFLDCPDRSGPCHAVLIPRVEPDEKITLPRNKPREALRFLTLKDFRARGGDPIVTLALFSARNGDSVYFDADNDEDLGDDGPGRFWPQKDSCVTWESRGGNPTFSLCRAGEHAKAWQARCETMKSAVTWAICDEGPYRLKVQDIVYGTLSTPARERRIGLADMDGDGKFKLQAGDRLVLDWDGDGVLDKSLDGDGFAIPPQEKSFVFSLDSATYELARVDDNGAWMEVRRRSGYDPGALAFKAVEGRPAPDLRFVNLDGDTVRLSDFRGKKVLLSFWSVLCKPCLDQLPGLSQFNAQFAAKNWQVISLTTDKELDLVQQAAMKHHINWMVGMAGPEARGYYANHPLPLNVKIDPQGVIEKKDMPLGKRPF